MRFRAFVGLLAAGVVMAGCFTSTADFQNDAEDFIRSDDQLASALETTFTTAECEEPENRDPGTTFVCDATDAESRSWEFEIVILDSNEYEVNVSRFP